MMDHTKFDRDFDRTWKAAGCLAVFAVLGYVAGMAIIAYVAYHFITKYW